MSNQTVDDGSPLILYEPPQAWQQAGKEGDPLGKRYFLETKSWTQTPNATASFTFNGTSITLIGAKRGNHGNYTVQLDDEPEKEFSGRAPDPGLFQTPLYSRDGLDGEKGHTIVLKNLGRGGDGFLDLDAINWTSTVASSSSPSSGSGSVPAVANITTTQFDDDSDEFSWGPTPAVWSLNPPDVKNFDGGTGHVTSTPGAFVGFTFPSTSFSVSLFGSIGPNHAPYAVFLNNIPMGNFSSKRSREETKVMLFHADGLGSASGNGSGGDNSYMLQVFHTGPIAGESVDSNGGWDNSTRRRRRQQQQQQPQPQILAIDFVQVASVSSTNTTNPAGGPVSSSGAFPYQTGASSMDGGNKGKVMFSTGTIVAIAMSVLAILVLLIVLIVLLCRRNKYLWYRLQKGYMVQSQFDATSSNPSLSSSPRPQAMRQRPNTGIPPTIPSFGGLNDDSQYHSISQFPIDGAAESQLTIGGHGHDLSTSSKGTTGLTDPFDPDTAHLLESSDDTNDTAYIGYGYSSTALAAATASGALASAGAGAGTGRTRNGRMREGTGPRPWGDENVVVVHNPPRNATINGNGNGGNQSRSGTMDTFATGSTLVAEDGSHPGDEPGRRRSVLKLVPAWGTLGHRRDSPPDSTAHLPLLSNNPDKLGNDYDAAAVPVKPSTTGTKPGRRLLPLPPITIFPKRTSSPARVKPPSGGRTLPRPPVQSPPVSGGSAPTPNSDSPSLYSTTSPPLPPPASGRRETTNSNSTGTKTTTTTPTPTSQFLPSFITYDPYATLPDSNSNPNSNPNSPPLDPESRSPPAPSLSFRSGIFGSGLGLRFNNSPTRSGSGTGSGDSPVLGNFRTPQDSRTGSNGDSLNTDSPILGRVSQRESMHTIADSPTMGYGPESGFPSNEEPRAGAGAGAGAGGGYEAFQARRRNTEERGRSHLSNATLPSYYQNEEDRPRPGQRTVIWKSESAPQPGLGSVLSSDRSGNR